MAQIYPLKLVRPDDVILTEVLINTHKASLVLDTGATNTIVDLDTLLIAGIHLFMRAGRNLKLLMGLLKLIKFK